MTEATARLTDNKPYHMAVIDGEARKCLIRTTISAPILAGVAPLVATIAVGRDRMAKLLALYKNPKDPGAFDKYYSSVHIPLAKKIPGLKKYDISKGTVGTPAGSGGIYLVATLYFDSLDAIKAALASPQGQAVAADLAKFADGGVELYFFDTKEV
jgi:uncharacterized protein (TIGR02118 family)